MNGVFCIPFFMQTFYQPSDSWSNASFLVNHSSAPFSVDLLNGFEPSRADDSRETPPPRPFPSKYLFIFAQRPISSSVAPERLVGAPFPASDRLDLAVYLQNEAGSVEEAKSGKKASVFVLVSLLPVAWTGRSIPCLLFFFVFCRARRLGELQWSWTELSCLDCACLQLWPKIVLKKWLNISSRESDFSADEAETTESEFEYEGCGFSSSTYFVYINSP